MANVLTENISGGPTFQAVSLPASTCSFLAYAANISASILVAMSQNDTAIVQIKGDYSVSKNTSVLHGVAVTSFSGFQVA